MKRKPWAEFILILLGSILYFMANLHRVAIPGAVFDVLSEDLQVSAHAVTTLGSVFMYSYAIGQLIIGVLIARYGGFRVVTIGSLLFFTGCLIFPFAPNINILYLSRILMGFGSASYYLGMINETRRLVPKENFGIVLSLILFVGYLGGIVANAPFVICINNIGWRAAFIVVAVLTTILSLIFISLDRTVEHVKVDKSVHMDLELFKSTFANKKNYPLYIFSCLNYGLYYVLQTVIGKKFLEDFCHMTVIRAAAVLSIMCFMYAIAGSVIAFLSKSFFDRKTVFLKISSFNAMLVFGLIFICICLNIKTSLIAVGFCIVAFGASLSPLLVTLLHDYNDPKVANTAVSVMTCLFYVVVAVLGGMIGFCLDYFTEKQFGSNYINHIEYIAIFGIMFILSIISFINVFKISETTKTLRLIQYFHYLKENEIVHHHDS